MSDASSAQRAERKPPHRGQACRRNAASDSAVSRRILGANSSSSGPAPPSTSALLTTRTRPPAAGSSTWSKTTLPNGTGHSLTQRRPASTAVMVKGPPRLPRCLAQPRAPGSNGPSSSAISLLTSHSGQRATSVHTFQTASGSASNVASHSNRCMTAPQGAWPGSEPADICRAALGPHAQGGTQGPAAVIVPQPDAMRQPDAPRSGRSLLCKTALSRKDAAAAIARTRACPDESSGELHPG